MTAPTPPNPQSPKDLFNAAIELPAGERAAFLQRACGGDAALRARVQRLLDAHEAEPQFLGSPTADVGHLHAGPLGETVTLPSTGATARETAGTRIGPYKLLQLIGEGGFGSVFMADQERPVHRRVALKIIKLGMDTRQVVARFEQERQALAMMDHPNIAKVLDAGATEQGRPYFVMELVKGEPVTDYCDRHQLPIAERLALFGQICYAVQHAHTKGVIHRDIKPSNVLVSTQDGRALAKVIDFGIAKATQQRLTEKTLFTEHQQLIGTPEYMSPEQAEGSLDIDTRTDVYSLGVLLYELLTGTTPFDGRRLRSAAFAEMQRIIREDDPPRPSTRLSQHATLAEVATRRRVEAARLGPMIRGDLDWVVMKALEKDRGRRYETPGALAQDLTRFLAGRPVDAAPPSPGYRARKFIRRHRGPVIAATIVTAALLVGAGLAAAGYISAVHARDAEIRARLAEQARAGELEQQTRVAEAARIAEASQRRRAETVARFLEKVLEAADPTVAGTNRDVTVREVLDDAARQLDAGDLEAEPLSEIEARRALAKTFALLGDFPRSDALLSRAQSIADATPAVPMTALADLAGAWSLLRLEQGRLEDSRVEGQRSLDLFTQALGPANPNTINAARGLAITLLDMGRMDDAAPILSAALKHIEPVAERYPDLYSDVLVTSARAASEQGRQSEAERLYRQSLDISRQRGDDTAVLHALNNLAVALVDQGRFTEAGVAFKEAFELSQRILDDDHPLIMRLRSNYCTILAREGRINEAEAILVDAAAQAKAKYGPVNPRYGSILHNLAVVQERAGHHEQSEATYRECLAIREAAGLGDHIDQANTASSFALALYREATPERLAEAEALLRKALDIRTRVLPPGDPMIGVAKTFLGSCLIRQAKYAEAEPLLTEGFEGQARAPGIDNDGLANTADTIVKLYERWEAADPGKGHAEKAEPWRKKMRELSPAQAEDK